MAVNRDPEVRELVATARELTGQAFRLSRSINEAVEELNEYRNQIELNRRTSQQPYQGRDRRRA